MTKLARTQMNAVLGGIGPKPTVSTGVNLSEANPQKVEEKSWWKKAWETIKSWF